MLIAVSFLIDCAPLSDRGFCFVLYIAEIVASRFVSLLNESDRENMFLVQSAEKV